MTSRVERLLVRGVNWLGDAVMTTPALLRLRERFPDAHITLLTLEKLRELWLHHPAVNEIISISADEGVVSTSHKLRVGHFDIALVLPNSLRTALEVWLAGIPQRTGCAGNGRSWLLTQPIKPRPNHVKMRKHTPAEIKRLVNSPAADTQHATRNTQPVTVHHLHQYLHLTTALGANPALIAPQVFITPEEIASARNKFGLNEMGQSVFGLNPGAEYGPAKRWPRERFIAAARDLQQRTNCRWLIFGGKADAPLATEIESALRTPDSALHNLAGKTSLRELMALLKICRVLLTNDSGPMHIAAALGTPVVVPFGSTSPEMTGPGRPGDAQHRLLKTNVPCSPCFLRECPIDFRCMNGISVDQVVEAAIRASSISPKEN